MKRQEADLPIQRIRQPVERIIHLENISGIALIGGALVALVVANSPLRETFDAFWKHHLIVAVGPFAVDESLGHWVNDALIAIFYTASVNTTALLVAVGLLAALVLLRVLGVWWMPLYVLFGVGLWFALLESGVHATLAGVACGLLAPAVPRRPRETVVVAGSHHTVDELKEIVFDTRKSRSVVDRLSHNLHPFTAMLIVPVFALANTAVIVDPSALTDAATSSAAPMPPITFEELEATGGEAALVAVSRPDTVSIAG